MNKQEFMWALQNRLAGLPPYDREERLAFYSEMIDDRIEDGLTEEEAVAGIGSVDDVVSQIMAEIPLSKLVKEKVRPKGSMRGWEIALMVLGFPLWFPLLCASLAVLLALYIVLWSIVICLYAVSVSFAAAVIACGAGAVFYFKAGNPAAVGLAVGAGIVMIGLTILMFVISAAVTRGVVKLTGRILLGIKTMFAGKEGA